MATKNKTGANAIRNFEQKSWAVFYQDGNYGIYCLAQGFDSKETAEQYAATQTSSRGVNGYGIAEMIGVVKPVAAPYKFVELE